MIPTGYRAVERGRPDNNAELEKDFILFYEKLQLNEKEREYNFLYVCLLLYILSPNLHFVNVLCQTQFKIQIPYCARKSLFLQSDISKSLEQFEPF